MSRAGGVALILGGLAVAAYGMPSGTGRSAPQSTLQADDGNRALADQRPSRDVSVLGRLAALRPIASATDRAAEPAFSAPVVVTIAQRPSEPSAVPSRAAAIPRDRDTLARALQKELRRVGCYEDELNGAWTPATRRAMKAFTDRVNATLPVEEPDGVLFVMVQSQQDRVCGKPCPVGQGISEGGRCLSNAILAKATKNAAPPTAVAQLPTGHPGPAAKRGRAIAGWSTTDTPAVAPAPPVASVSTEGRMGLAGPTQEPRPAAGRNPRATAKPHVRSRAAARGKRSRGETRVVSAPRRGTFARTFMRRFESSL